MNCSIAESNRMPCDTAGAVMPLFPELSTASRANGKPALKQASTYFK